jgi:hypothetical protein
MSLGNFCDLKITLSLQPSLSCDMVGIENGFREPPLDFLRCDCKKTLLHVVASQAVSLDMCLIFYRLIASTRCDERRPCSLSRTLSSYFWSLAIAATPAQALARKQDFVSPTLQLSSLFNARIPPINYNFQPEFDHSCLGCVSWRCHSRGTSHSPCTILSPQARSKPNDGSYSSFFACRNKKDRLYPGLLSTASSLRMFCHKHGPGNE